jgi:hypothetical protein
MAPRAQENSVVPVRSRVSQGRLPVATGKSVDNARHWDEDEVRGDGANVRPALEVGPDRRNLIRHGAATVLRAGPVINYLSRSERREEPR